MASEQTHCRGCGRPLEGRDRFEGACPACREAAILGAPSPADAPGAAGRGAPARRHAAAWLALALAAGAALIIGAAVLMVPDWRSRGAGPPVQVKGVPTAASPAPSVPRPVSATPPPAPKPVPPELAATLRLETRELLGLLARASYDRVIDNYVQPDEGDFARVERALDEIVKGGAAKGFAALAARLSRQGMANVTDDLRRVGDAEPDLTVALVAHLMREPGSSDARLSSEDRARSTLRWHLASLFEGLDLPAADIGAVLEVRPGVFEAALACRGERRAAWLRQQPVAIHWARLPVGWVVKAGLAERLERVRDTLKAAAAREGPSAPPGG
ncbi:MAG: hypothetical protein FJ291_22230 [Planctomycetes bacterium]|nr:hypothetical protein [Planctomycetota bacterium]